MKYSTFHLMEATVSLTANRDLKATGNIFKSNLKLLKFINQTPCKTNESVFKLCVVGTKGGR